MAHHDAEMTERTPEERQADHAAIDRLADELLPALVAKLGASGLGELDVREGGWRLRLRMPADARAARRGGGPGRGGHAAPATHPATATHAAPAGPVPIDGATEGPPTRAVATAPAVGFYRPRPELAAGARVRAGDRLGTIDVLGIPQELVSPADGIVGASLVEPGDPVEYGQEIVEIELPAAPSAAAPSRTAPAPSTARSRAASTPAAPATAGPRPEVG